jgi:hypothetical protein
MMAMAEELGGTLSIRRSRSGGVFLRVDVPLAPSGRDEPVSRPPSEGGGGDA